MPLIAEHRKGLSELKEARKVEIIDAAEALFLERGLAAVTIKDLVETLGISRVTFYRYFPDIHPLAMEVAGRMMGQMYAQALSCSGLLDSPREMSGNRAAIHFFTGLISAYPNIIPQLRFMGMFDQYYSQNYPSEELAMFYRQTLKNGYAKSSFYEVFPYQEHTPAERQFFVTLANMVFAALEKIATRGELLEKEQGVTINAHLTLLKKMIATLEA